MKTITPVIGQELEDVIYGLSMSPSAKETLLACCNRADRLEAPQQLAETCREVTKGSLDEEIQKQGVKALAALLQREIKLTESYLMIYPHKMPEEQQEEAA